MIITKTPYRISLFGGGTDFEEYNSKNKGLVIGATINKYCYVSIRDLPPFFNHNYRIAWSRIENVKKIKEIVHPTVKSVLHFAKLKKGQEIHYDGDLPGNSGIGSSSSFCVGLLNAINNKKKYKITKEKLAYKAYKIENKIMKEHVGMQDQIWASYGGVNYISFKNKKFKVNKLPLKLSQLKKLQENLLLFYTGKTRFSSDIEKDKKKQLDKKIFYYKKIYTQAKNVLSDIKSGNLDSIGENLDEYWHLKKQLSNKVSNKEIDEIYHEAKLSGAKGGKILGSGGGGFILFYCNKKNQKKLKNRLKKLLAIDFKFENKGSQVIFNNEI